MWTCCLYASTPALHTCRPPQGGGARLGVYRRHGRWPRGPRCRQPAAALPDARPAAVQQLCVRVDDRRGGSGVLRRAPRCQACARELKSEPKAEKSVCCKLKPGGLTDARDAGAWRSATPPPPPRHKCRRCTVDYRAQSGPPKLLLLLGTAW
eukprot:365257-Chlamydomonas_euryale.AAC.12